MITPARVLPAEKYYPLSFDGVNDYVNCGNGASLQLTNNFTVGTRVKINGPLLIRYGIISKLNSTHDGWSLTFDNSNKFIFWIMNNGVVNPVYSDLTYTNKVWHDFVGIVDNGVAKIYIDNKKQNIEINATPSNPTLDVKIGVFYCNTNNNPLNGISAESYIYNRVLSEDEIKQLYYHKPILDGLVLWTQPQRKYEGTLWDRSGKGNNGTIYGATPSTEEYNARPLRIVA